MAQPKISCKNRNCRRVIGKDVPKCPFCGYPNSEYQAPTPKATAEAGNPSSSTKSPQSVDAQTSDLNISSSGEISINDLENMYHEPIAVQPVQTVQNKDVPIQEQDMDGNDAATTEQKQALSAQESSTISATQASHRSKISWDDEDPNKESGNFTEMFNEKGQYQANYDGYYNDTLPKIINEIDHVLVGKEKAILKAVTSVVAIFAIIIYLVLTN